MDESIPKGGTPVPGGGHEGPLVSVVTPSFNQARFIGETIASVLAQDYPRLEYIVVDGGSTDGTREVLQRFSGRITWIAEPDHGQADAINKGFAMSRGEIIAWINSDDTYCPGAVADAVSYLTGHPEAVMVYGDAHLTGADGAVLGTYPSEPFDLRRLADTCFICQPSVFMRRSVLETVGPLDISVRTSLDYDYWIRIGRAYAPSRIRYLRGSFLASSRIHADTKTMGQRRTVYRETMRLQKRHFGRVSWRWRWGWVREFLLCRPPKIG